MANETELEKIDRAAEYFERYFEFEDAVTVSMENKEYLKTYIHDNDYVVKNFNIKNKIIKSPILSIMISSPILNCTRTCAIKIPPNPNSKIFFREIEELFFKKE